MNSQSRFTPRTAALAALAFAALTTSGIASAATPEELEARVNALAAQVVSLQNEVAALKAQRTAAAPAVGAGSATAAAPAVAAATPAQSDRQVQWFGYG